MRAVNTCMCTPTPPLKAGWGGGVVELKIKQTQAKETFRLSRETSAREHVSPIVKKGRFLFAKLMLDM